MLGSSPSKDTGILKRDWERLAGSHIFLLSREHIHRALCRVGTKLAPESCFPLIPFFLDLPAVL